MTSRPTRKRSSTGLPTLSGSIESSFPPARAAERVHLVETAPPSRRLVRTTRKIITWMHARRMHRAATRFRKSALGRFVYEGGRPYGPLAPDVEARLRELYRPEVEAFEALIGRDLPAWKYGKSPAAAKPPGATRKPGPVDNCSPRMDH